MSLPRDNFLEQFVTYSTEKTLVNLDKEKFCALFQNKEFFDKYKVIYAKLGKLQRHRISKSFKNKKDISMVYTCIQKILIIKKVFLTL